MRHASQDLIRRRELLIPLVRPRLRREIRAKHGTDGGPAGAYDWLPRNNEDHMLGVESYAVDLAKELAWKGEIPPAHVMPIQLGAIVHDIEQRLGTHEFGPDPSGGANERASGERAVAELRNLQQAFPGLVHDEDMQVAREFVAATTVEITSTSAIQAVRSPKVMGPGGGRFHVVQEIGGDADLSETGRWHGVHHAEALLAQKAANRGAIVLPDTVDGFAQVRFDPDWLLEASARQPEFFANRADSWWRPESAARLNRQLERNMAAFKILHERLERDLEAGVPSGVAYLNALDASVFYRVHHRLPEPGELAPREYPTPDVDMPVSNVESFDFAPHVPAPSDQPPWEIPVRNGAVLVTDMVGSVEHHKDLSTDESAVFDLRHRALLEAAAAPHGGVVAGDRGDGSVIRFGTERAAMEAAASIQKAVADDNARNKRSISIRIGLGVGEVATTDGGIHGTAVHEATRLCHDVAGPNEIAMPNAAVDEAAAARLEMAPAKTIELRGLGETQVRVAKVPDPQAPAEPRLPEPDDGAEPPEGPSPDDPDGGPSGPRPPDLPTTTGPSGAAAEPPDERGDIAAAQPPDVRRESAEDGELVISDIQRALRRLDEDPNFDPSASAPPWNRGEPVVVEGSVETSEEASTKAVETPAESWADGIDSLTRRPVDEMPAWDDLDESASRDVTAPDERTTAPDERLSELPQPQPLDDPDGLDGPG